MPIKKTQSKTFSPRRNYGLLVAQLLLLGLLILALAAGFWLMGSGQDLRQQAAGCSEGQVSTRFRKYEAGTDKPWTEGTGLAVKINDTIDVNCFAKTGTALLSNAKITLKIDGTTATIPATYVTNGGSSLKAFPLAKGGTYTFACTNTAGCSSSNQLTVPKTTTPPVTTPPGTCTNPSVADLNKDCSVNLKDYDIFLTEYIKRQK